MAPHDSAALFDADRDHVEETIEVVSTDNVVPIKVSEQPDRTEAEAAVKTLIAYTGEDAERRPGDPGGRQSLDEWFAAMNDAETLLSKTFDEVEAIMHVLLRDIPFHSHCEHHKRRCGKAHVAYMPRGVVGISNWRAWSMPCPSVPDSGADDGRGGADHRAGA